MGGRLEGVTAAITLGKLHEAARFYVNFFQPSFKLKSKTRQGAKVMKKYQTPATPYQRLLASDRVTNGNKDSLRQVFSALDPVELLSQIRLGQRTLAALETGGDSKTASETTQDLNRFVQSLSVIWRDGEVRPALRKRFSGPRAWRMRVDPFENVWPVVEQWLSEQPDVTANELFHIGYRHKHLIHSEPGQLRTLQRWRTIQRWTI